MKRETLDARLQAFAAWAGAEASTRGIAIVRIGVPLIALSEWGDGLILVRDLRPSSVLISTAFFLSMAALLVGIRSRLSALCAAASVALVLVVFGEFQGRLVVHHHTQLLLLATAILALTPCGGSYSLDRVLARRRNVPCPERGPVWGQYLLRVLVSSVYLWGMYGKLTPAFLMGARLEHLYVYYYADADMPSAALRAVMIAASWGTILLEVFLAIGLWSRRPRVKAAAIALGIAFHLAIYLLLPVSTFSALMILLYVTFLDPDALHAFLDEQHAAERRVAQPD